VLGRHRSALERGPVQARALWCPSGVRAEGALASAGILAKKAGGRGSKNPVANAASGGDSGLVRRGRGTFSYKG